MSIRMRATLGAIVFCLGILLAIGGSVEKSSEKMRYEREVQKQKPDPRPADTTTGTVVSIVGLLLIAAGAGVIGFAFRDVTRDIREAQSRAEMSLRSEIAQKRDSKPKP